MVVLIPNALATTRRRGVGGVDQYGERAPGALADPGEMLPATVTERGDGGWAIGLDPSLWPVSEGDRVVDADGREFAVVTADLNHNPAAPEVDWIVVEALRHVPGVGTRPADPGFVGREP